MQSAQNDMLATISDRFKMAAGGLTRHHVTQSPSLVPFHVDRTSATDPPLEYGLHNQPLTRIRPGPHRCNRPLTGIRQQHVVHQLFV